MGSHGLSNFHFTSLHFFIRSVHPEICTAVAIPSNRNKYQSYARTTKYGCVLCKSHWPERKWLVILCSGNPNVCLCDLSSENSQKKLPIQLHYHNCQGIKPWRVLIETLLLSDGTTWSYFLFEIHVKNTWEAGRPSKRALQQSYLKAWYWVVESGHFRLPFPWLLISMFLLNLLLAAHLPNAGIP